MVQKAREHNLVFRPHFKTHQSLEIGRWFRDEGVSAITVSSLRMACFFAEDGWDDITVAIPVNTRDTLRINTLAKNIKLHLLVADQQGIENLAAITEYRTKIWIKIDTGYHRTGVLHDDHTLIQNMLMAINKNELLHFEGFITHSGHSYYCRSHQEILDVHNDTIEKLSILKSYFKSDFPNLKISVGDTPTCSVADHFGEMDEIRPGNFVFYDTMQVQISACEPEDIAVVMACPVVAKHKDRNEIILIGGGIHFSKDFITTSDGSKNFGDLVFLSKDGWTKPVAGCFLSKLSQEHGTLKVTDSVFDTIKTGDIVGILPVHSCMTANLMAKYFTLSGVELDYFDLRKNYFT